MRKSDFHHFVIQSTYMKLTRYLFIIFLGLGAVAASAGFLLSGSEAHVINVTAKIEPPMCDARSIGFWGNNEGCSQGAGSSNWTDKVHALSSAYSGAFASHTGADMCVAVWMPNCAALALSDRDRCEAEAHTLAVELNVASNRLHLSAFLAGVDDGDSSFPLLHLYESSTVHEALITLETILADSSATFIQLRRAAYVAERIYTFYESENPFHPRCVFDRGDLPACRPLKGDVTVINENNASIENNVSASANTGGNTVGGSSGGEGSDGGSPPAGGENGGDNNETGDGGDGGEGGAGGTVITGDAEAEAVVENEVNTNITQVGCENCAPCEDPCAEADEEAEDTAPLEVQSEDIATESEDPVVLEEAGEEADPPPDEQLPAEGESAEEDVQLEEVVTE